ncbi:MAG: gliding motility protein GldC [Bacteroidota bacterium]
MSELKSIAKTTTITLKVGLDKDNVPTKLDWTSDDNPEAIQGGECKAFLLSLFDKEHRDTLKIDLWTTEMQVIEMDRFFYQTLRGLCDTYVRATKNNELGNQMRQFVEHFGKATEILPKDE